MHVQIGDGLSVGDQESDCDDDDRRELISHYANDKYLNKWEVAEEEEEIEEERDWRKVFVPYPSVNILTELWIKHYYFYYYNYYYYYHYYY